MKTVEQSIADSKEILSKFFEELNRRHKEQIQPNQGNPKSYLEGLTMLKEIDSKIKEFEKQLNGDKNDTNTKGQHKPRKNGSSS